ncbi:hypothetical protein [Cellulomonas sp. Leaf334]|uniref:hypothetical protein n=1 Tax=Cellulomonas sp. Leaf334 TaxID=1736339 RepID=UPI0007008E17|nr:hypothetical protein [Cellulomonas sp. Leaf334]KQR11669.1 hypothetical protein ASF78_10515 [Cellulomonas sp. Leaf334]
MPVHRSKHSYWSLSGDLLETSPRTVRFAGRGVAVTSEAADRWRVAAQPWAKPSVVGEAVFHVQRSVALYRRDSATGPLLHASGVLGRDGRAVLFTGSVSAGKTTLLTEAVVTYGAVPLTNDRAWLRIDADVTVQSWPSYASFCEGTLITYPVLRGAAERFESERDNPLRTTAHPEPLRYAFDKDTKRIYPMSWFTDATNTRFVPSATLGTLVLSRLEVARGASELRELDLTHDVDRRMLVDVLQDESFDSHEPSFLPWHGLPMPVLCWPPEKVADALRDAGVRVVVLRADPTELSVLADLL